MLTIASRNVHTNPARLERWLGKEKVEALSRNMRNWYGPPIALIGVPGCVQACGDGNFRGKILAGAELSAEERLRTIVKQEGRRRLARMGVKRKQLGAFGSLSALIAAATGGKSQWFMMNKVGIGPTAAGNAVSLWAVGSQPAAGSAGAAAPVGTANSSSSTGAVPGYQNGKSTNSNHLVSGWLLASVAGNSIMVYDRLFSVAKTMSSTATEAVTGVPTRYQNSGTPGAIDYPAGNFVFPETIAALGATGHNWTVCQYTDQDGNTAQAIPSIGGITSGVANQIDLTAGNWFMPLASGDTGVKALTQMQCSASVTGTLDFVIGHPLGIMACPIANMATLWDGINSAFNLVVVMDNACVAFFEMPKPSTTATTYSGMQQIVSE